MSSVTDTLDERGKRYGDFSDHARICQDLKEVMLSTTMPSAHDPQRGWAYLRPYQKQALEVIADKIARILSGDPDYADNWHDIQGYAKLVEDRLPEVVKAEGVKPKYKTGFCSHGIPDWRNCVHCQAGELPTPTIPGTSRFCEAHGFYNQALALCPFCK